MRIHICIIVWALGLFSATISQVLPYNPTTILDDPKNKNHVYVFQRMLSSSNYHLVSIDISSTLSTSNLSFNVVSPDLPFSDDDDTALIPTISEQGTISVYTGLCEAFSTSALWRFHMREIGSKTSGNWDREPINTPVDQSSASLPGAQFLSRGISFSPLVDGNSTQTNMYIFGGMCPKQNASTENWQSAARYSNQMLRISQASDLNYTIDMTSSRSSAVAEAGFSLTGLIPSFLNTSNITTQQRSYVLIGGHTSDAFISMSQIAIWNLPEEAWNFVKVDMPLATKLNSQSAIDDDSRILDCRSGHTAVLSEDGSKIIVFGGWVGNISQSAYPQLAVLELGAGYGGLGNWEWSIPKNQPSGTGIYGHGAIMLPGNVMMIVGGSDISLPLKRAAVPELKAMFFNATSLEWISSYTNPGYVSDQNIHQGTSSLGIRIAVGLGLVAIAGIVLLSVGYRRHRSQKDQRENNIRSLSEMATNLNVGPKPEMKSTDGGGLFPWSNNGWNNRYEPQDYDDPHSESHRPTARYENLDSGGNGLDEFVYVLPTSTKAKQRASFYPRSRGGYQTGNYESSGLGVIHPIYEADENDEIDQDDGDLGVAHGNSVSAEDRKKKINRNSDPFKDPQIYHASSSGQNPFRRAKTPESDILARERNIKEWVSDWAEGDIVMSSEARLQSTITRNSPSRRATVVTASTPDSVTAEEDRSSISNFSERTDKSHVASELALGHSTSLMSRSTSLRSFIMGINPFSSNNHPTTARLDSGNTDHEAISDGKVASIHSAQNVASGSANSSRSVKSFRSAQTSVQSRTNEGEHLLGPNPESSRPETAYSLSEAQETSISGSPSKNKPQLHGKGRANWLGSLKRVFVFSPEENDFRSKNYDLGCHSAELGPSSLLNRKDGPREPRRAVSASGSLLRRKLVKSDWEANPSAPADTSGCSSSSESVKIGLARSSMACENELETERTIENQRSRVTFTNSQDRLHLANQDLFTDKGEGSGSSILDGGISSSVRSLKALSKPSIREITYSSDSDESELDEIPSFPEYKKENFLNKDKGKQKASDFGMTFQQNEKHELEQTEHSEDGDLSIPMKEKGKNPSDILRPASQNSRASSSRKSRVLEIVERMESKG
ncbi:putative galactose oxidase kelch beta-propeller protein [Golovinomyces cichoracearum]|uniref:Putative galactose oxidase kelch beta-propeller protein n=1 Tax=Golovinomyces cichoracearum TaxID=62708 RepID=A0A420IKC4_9PEZI|nr:putative galactose oxidase kelch beta-propeller protein [Golovinomyces cichoracearum]